MDQGTLIGRFRTVTCKKPHECNAFVWLNEDHRWLTEGATTDEQAAFRLRESHDGMIQPGETAVRYSWKVGKTVISVHEDPALRAICLRLGVWE